MSIIRSLQMGIVVILMFGVSIGHASSGAINTLSPNGIRLGGFNLFPIVTGGYRMDDNIYASQSEVVSDTSQIVSAGFGLNSNWSRHNYYLNGGSAIGRYSENKNEDYDDYNFSTGGKLAILRGINLFINGSHNILHEDRGTPDEASGIRPTIYTLSTAGGKLSHSIGRLSAIVGADMRDYKYEDTPTTDGVITNGDRVRVQSVESLRLAYEMVTGYQAVLKTSINQRNYANQLDDNGEDRNSTGNEVLGGLDLRLGSPLNAELLVGFATQDYADPGLADVSDMSYGINLVWVPTALTSVKSKMQRTIEETTSLGSSSRFTSTFSLGVRHALMKSVTLAFNLGRSNLEYKGSTRIDTNTTIAGGVIYNTNRYIHVVLDYSLGLRSSNLPGMDYSRSLTTLSLGGHI